MNLVVQAGMMHHTSDAAVPKLFTHCNKALSQLAAGSGSRDDQFKQLNMRIKTHQSLIIIQKLIIKLLYTSQYLLY